MEFVQNLEYYLSCEIKESSDDSKNYPVGTIIPKDDKHIPIELNFMHYSSFEEACMKWKERSKRVDFDRLYFIWHFYDETDTARIKVFDRWSVKKLAILHEPINGVHSAVITDCYNKDPYNGKILQVIEKTGKRYLDDIDYISFLSD